MTASIYLFIGGMLMAAMAVYVGWICRNRDTPMIVDILLLVFFVFGMFMAGNALTNLDLLAERTIR